MSLANLLQDLDIGAVQRADGDGSVQRQLHVAGSRCFRAGSRDLFAEIGGRDDLFSERYTVVRNKRDLDPIARPRVVVDDAADVVDQFDDLLREPVTGRRLARKDVSSGHRRCLAIFDQRQVLVNDMHDVEQLPLVGVNPFDLNIEKGIRIRFALASCLRMIALSRSLFVRLIFLNSAWNPASAA